MDNLKGKWKKNFKYILFGTILWGVLILPLFHNFFLGDVLLSGELIFLSVLFSFLATSAPIYWEFLLPPEGKEYYILFYPIVTIPLLIIGLKIREFLY